MNREEILKAFQFRHACKEFDFNKKISDADFELILESARLSPSSFGFEPWHFVVVQNPNLREKLKDGAWGAEDQLLTASHFVVALTLKPSLVKYDSSYIQNMMKDVQLLPDSVVEMKSKFYKIFQLIDFDLRSDNALFDWASKQSYIPLANMMTVAALLGIDSCPMEGFNKQTTEEVLRNDFGIDTEMYGISYMVAFGYRIEEPRPKTRRKMDEVVSWRK